MAWGAGGGQRAVGYTERQRKDLLRKYPVCMLQIAGTCTHWATEIHHVIGRKRAGRHIGGKNLITACHECHNHETQKDAIESRDDWKRKPEKHPGVLD